MIVVTGLQHQVRWKGPLFLLVTSATLVVTGALLVVTKKLVVNLI